MMQLSDLLTYAMERYQIAEDRKWAGFPGFSVLVEPQSGKWVALLMRGWNPELGEMMEKCDLRCGRAVMTRKRSTFLSVPTRMHGLNWLGVSFNGTTDEELVYRLFDRAVADLRKTQQGYTIMLDGGSVAKDTPIQRDSLILPGGFHPASQDPDVPERIREMLSIYEYGDGSFHQKCLNFYRQGRLMEDYEDNEPWEQPYRHYFPTYHDMNVRQLRGYFTWRTHLRKGLWETAPLSFAYLYIYELLNGIGVKSTIDSLAWMEEFEREYIDGGMGDDRMREYLHRWMLELSIVRGLPTETTGKYADPAMTERDAALGILRQPKEHTDAEVYAALCKLSGRKEESAPAVKKKGDEGRHLFAQAWQPELFESCFGKPKWYRWHPLSNAVYYEEEPHQDCEYVLNGCRRYKCDGGEWQMECYEPLYFDRKRLQSFMRATDRLLRQYLKTGSALTAKPEEEWAQPCVMAAIEADRREKIEAARPKINIDLSGLAQIRQDADVTRESLLTEEERMTEATEPCFVETVHSDTSEQEEPMNRRLLRMLLTGEDICPLISEHHLMPTIVADSINEEFIDDIGDNVVEYDGQTLSLVDDYKEELAQMIMND